MKYAIVESGGKQYKAVEGAVIEVDKMPEAVGETVALDQVLFLADGDEYKVGTPTVAGAKVSSKVVAQFKGPKVVIFKYRAKKRERTKTGHRQQYTRLQIESIIEE